MALAGGAPGLSPGEPTRGRLSCLADPALLGAVNLILQPGAIVPPASSSTVGLARAGPYTLSSWRTRWASTRRTLQRWAASTRTPYAPPGSSSIQGSTSLVGPDSRPSITCLAHTADSRTTIESELDRYIIDPGQATAYMVGRLEIERLRREAERRLGSGFDVPTFHDHVLEDGNVTLPMLRQKIERWLADGGWSGEFATRWEDPVEIRPTEMHVATRKRRSCSYVPTGAFTGRPGAGAEHLNAEPIRVPKNCRGSRTATSPRRGERRR